MCIIIHLEKTTQSMLRHLLRCEDHSLEKLDSQGQNGVSDVGRRQKKAGKALLKQTVGG